MIHALGQRKRPSINRGQVNFSAEQTDSDILKHLSLLAAESDQLYSIKSA